MLLLLYVFLIYTYFLYDIEETSILQQMIDYYLCSYPLKILIDTTFPQIDILMFFSNLNNENIKIKIIHLFTKTCEHKMRCLIVVRQHIIRLILEFKLKYNFLNRVFLYIRSLL
jgi:hypothetical protein